MESPPLSERALRTLPDPIKRRLRRGAATFATATSAWRTLPDYVVIGAQRCGTTSLWWYLVKHPNVARSLTKEVQYFSVNYHRGLPWYRSNFPSRPYRAVMERIRGGRLMSGEASPYYLFHPLAPQRVAKVLPDTMLIAMLRDPVERAYSHYQLQVRFGLEELSFEDAIAREPERLAGEEDRIRSDPGYVGLNHRRYSYLARGHYAEQLARWFALFPRERVLVLQSEDFFARPDRVFAEVLRFLGLPAWSPRSFPTYNARQRRPMDPATRRRLKAHFKRPNQQLEELLARRFDWAD